MRSLLFALPFLVFLAACQSVPFSEFNKVELGFEKGRVLSLLGNPEHRYRKADTDRWVYRWPQESDKSQFIEKEIWFQNGRVVYRDGDAKPSKAGPAQPTNDDFEQVK